MGVATMSRFFALLAVPILLGAIVLSATLLARQGGRLPGWAEQARAHALPAAWAVATTATAGSLYYSEVVGFVPCALCWYQRIAMYPLVVILGIAVLRRDEGVTRYVLPLAAIGGFISSYHYLVQHIPDLGPPTCSTGAPCTAAYVWEFGFVSIPFMALAGFAAISALMLTLRR